MRRASRAPGRRCGGVALASVLMLLVLVMLLALAGARGALYGEKAGRNDRDRLLALQAAEAALLDAESDLMMAAGARAAFLSGDDDGGLGLDECGRADGESLHGLCVASEAVQAPVWLREGLLETGSSSSAISYGRYTSRVFPTAGGPLPVHAPRYLIERLPPEQAGNAVAGAARAPVVRYRVTALGFGASAATRVLLQASYQRVRPRPGTPDAVPTRTQWREILNWSELHDEAKQP